MTNVALQRELNKQRAKIIDHNRKAIDSLIETVGGSSELATMLNIHFSTVAGWKDRGRISKAGAKLVEEHLTLGKYYKATDLRSDLLK